MCFLKCSPHQCLAMVDLGFSSRQVSVHLTEYSAIKYKKILGSIYMDLEFSICSCITKLKILEGGHGCCGMQHLSTL